MAPHVAAHRFESAPLRSEETARSEGDATVRGALVVSAIVAPALLLVSAILQDPSLAAAAETRDLLRLLSFAVAVPTYLALGAPLVASSRRGASSDLAVLVVAGLALAASTVATIAGRGAVFYDAGCVALAVATAARTVVPRARRGGFVAIGATLAAGAFAVFLRRPEVAWSPLVIAACLAPGAFLAASARNAVAAISGVAAAATVLAIGALVTGGSVPGAAVATGLLVTTAASLATAASLSRARA